MQRILTFSILTLGGAGIASAGGLDRSGQPVTLLFKDGNYGEVSVSHTDPDVSGDDLTQMFPNPAAPGTLFPYSSGQSYDSVSDEFTSYGFGLKYDVDDQLTIALMGSEDFGADIEYEDEPGSLLGGTIAEADTYALTLMARYKLTDNWAVHGGVRRDTADGQIRLSGLAYGGLDGYEVNLDDNIGYGYLVGASYEVPEIALRIAVTYNSEIRHDFKTSETLGRTDLPSSGKTDVDTPQSVNVDLQTGIAEDTLLFGSIRWAEWSEFKIAPDNFNELTGTSDGLVSLDDFTTYTVGVGRKFTDAFSASAAVFYEDATGDDLVSPLSPIHGQRGVQLGASYRVNDVEFAGGIRYAWLGDAKAETGTPDVARADFEDNTAVSVGLRVGYYF